MAENTLAQDMQNSFTNEYDDYFYKEPDEERQLLPSQQKMILPKGEYVTDKDKPPLEVKKQTGVSADRLARARSTVDLDEYFKLANDELEFSDTSTETTSNRISSEINKAAGREIRAVEETSLESPVDGKTRTVGERVEGVTGKAVVNPLREARKEQDVERILGPAKAFTEGKLQQVFVDLPTFGFGVYEYGTYGVNILGNALKEYGLPVLYNMTKFIPAEMHALINEVNVDHRYKPLPSTAMPGFLTDWADTFIPEQKKAFYNALDEYVKPIHQHLLRQMGGKFSERELKGNIALSLMYKAGLLHGRFLPFSGGVKSTIETVGLTKQLKKAGESTTKAFPKAVKGSLSNRLKNVWGDFAIATAAGTGWQVADSFLPEQYKDVAPLFALPAALFGPSITRRSVGHVFAALIWGGSKIPLVKKVGFQSLRESNFGKRLVLMGSGVPVARAFSTQPDKLDDLLGETRFSDVGLQKIAEAVQGLEPAYRKEIMQAWDKFMEMKDVIGDETTGKLILYISEVTGLANTQGLINITTASEKQGMITRVTDFIRVTELEQMQKQNGANITLLRKEILKDIEKYTGGKKETSQVLQNLLTKVDSTLDDLLDEHNLNMDTLDDMATSNSVYTKLSDQQNIRQTAEEVFFYDKYVPSSSLSVEEQFEFINNNKKTFKDKVVKRINNSFQKVKNPSDKNYKKYKEAIKGETIRGSSLNEFLEKIGEFVDEYSEPAIASFTKNARGVNSKDKIITFARKTTLEKDTVEQIQSRIFDLKKLEDTQNLNMQKRNGETFTVDELISDVQSLADELTEQGFDAIEIGKRQKLFITKELSEMRVTNAITGGNADNLINNILQPELKISDVVSFKSDLLDKYRQQYGNSQGYVTGQLHDATRELLESLRHDRPELEKLRKTATDYYRKNVVPWKNKFSTQLKDISEAAENRDILKTVNDLGPEDMFTLFLNSKNYEKMAGTFKTLFGKKGESFTDATELLQETIGRILSGDFPKAKSTFIDNLSFEDISTLKTENLITTSQATRLMSIVKKKVDMGEKAKSAIAIELARNVSKKYIKPLQEHLQKEYFDVFGDKIQNLSNSDNFVQALLEEEAITYGFKRNVVDRAKSNILRNTGTDSVEAIDEAVEVAVRNIPESKGRIKLSDAFFDFVENKIMKFDKNGVITKESKKEAKELIESLEALVIQHHYSKSFTLTPNRATGVPRQEPNGFFSKFDNSGLYTDIDLKAMADNLDKSHSLYERIANIKTRYGLFEKGQDNPNQTFQKLIDVYEISRISVSKLANVAIKNVTQDMAISGILSRIYAGLRGVVSPRYLLTDAIIRATHRKQAEFLSNLFTDPQSVSVVHDIMVNRKPPSQEQVKHMKKLFFLVIGNTINQFNNRQIGKLLEFMFSPDLDDQNIKQKAQDVFIKQGIQEQDPRERYKRLMKPKKDLKTNIYSTLPNT